MHNDMQENTYTDPEKRMQIFGKVVARKLYCAKHSK